MTTVSVHEDSTGPSGHMSDEEFAELMCVPATIVNGSAPESDHGLLFASPEDLDTYRSEAMMCGCILKDRDVLTHHRFAGHEASGNDLVVLLAARAWLNYAPPLGQVYISKYTL